MSQGLKTGWTSNLFRNDACLYKMDVDTIIFVESSWMTVRRGEGGEEIGNLGWSAAKSFSQETEAQGQRGEPRMGMFRPTLKSTKRRMRADPLTQLPFFVFQTARSLSDE